MRVLLTLIVAGLPSLAEAGCLAPATPGDVDALLARAEQAYERLDTSGFGTAVDEAAIALPCLDQPVSATLAARYHAIFGVRMYAIGEAERAQQAFAANKGADPSWTFPAAMIPEGHEIRMLHDAARADAGADPLLPPAAGLSLVVDGTPATGRPRDRAVIFQVVGADHVETAYLFPGDPTPDYASAPTTPAEVPRARRPLPLPRIGAAVAGLGLAVGSGVVYADAASSAAHFSDTDNGLERDALLDLSDQVNRKVALSAGLGVGAATALGVAIAWPF